MTEKDLDIETATLPIGKYKGQPAEREGLIEATSSVETAPMNSTPDLDDDVDIFSDGNGDDIFSDGNGDDIGKDYNIYSYYYYDIYSFS